MPAQLWTFTLAGFEIDEIRETQSTIEVHAHSMTTRASCPACHRVSDRIHSYYSRTMKDLPSVEFSMQLQLSVPRFRCLNAKCKRATFSEPLDRLAPKHAQRTRRFSDACYTLGLALGGEAGQRAAHKLHLPASADSLLRILRSTPIGTSSSIFHVIGIDDWAFKRRQTYGTLIVDLEQHQPIELLPDRTAETVAAWLKQHPEIRVVTRDRSTEFTRGINLGAPQAKQVADRWHLLKNLTEVLERILTRLRAELRKMPVLGGNAPIIQRPENRAKSEQIARAARRRNRLTRYDQVRALHLAGVPIKQIALRLKLSHMTVRKFVHAETYPETAPRPRASALTPFEPHLLKRWQDGCRNALQLWREVCAQGYRGTNRQVSKWVGLRREEPKRYSPMSKRRRPSAAPTTAPSQPHGTAVMTLPSANRLAWLLAKEQEQLDDKERLLLKHVLQHPVAAKSHTLAQQFTTMVRQRQPRKLRPWLKTCRQSTIREFMTFADGLESDIAAVQAALQLDWSNGQLEGQVNRLKLIKRQMYGRAKFDLLRIRVLSKP